MINAILNGLINFLFNIINYFLSPIDSYITQNLPVVSTVISYIDTLLTYILGFIGFCIDASGLHPIAIGLIVAYLVFAVSSTLFVYVVKLCIKWWHALVP